MKAFKMIASLFLFAGLISCNASQQNTAIADNSTAAAPAGGQENVQDDVSAIDVVKIAMSSKDHTTLVAAIKQADLVTSLSNAGPFTVFAPTNAAFDKIDKGTLNALMQDDKKEDLQNILQYHVTLSTIKAENLTNGQVLGMVNGDNVTVNIKDGKIILNGTATIIASIPATNGIIHVIDNVLMPPAHK